MFKFDVISQDEMTKKAKMRIAKAFSVFKNIRLNIFLPTMNAGMELKAERHCRDRLSESSTYQLSPHQRRLKKLHAKIWEKSYCDSENVVYVSLVGTLKVAWIEPSTSLAAKDRQKRRAKLVDSSWRQASGAGILPEEWDLFTERSQEPSVRRALEVNLDGPGERARPASEPRWKQLVFPAHCLAAGVL
ncbi:hypothetical protein HPB50_021544 [Hyalomma asiaticum]|uniref:Uncharacterized protein n=1 Tax=Hyalomma asiaticum TaxID=266040 RepID=A0ACB7TLP1_HYAAI|nr:hypothetical protein HPB50_021544 [Hyalomma asiaticum]